MTKWPTVRAGDVLELSRDVVDVEPLETYRLAGLYSFGRGLFWKQAILGSETKYTRFYRLSAAQAVMSKLFAWEGALAVVSEEFDGALVSSEFPTFDVDTEQASPEYIGTLFRWAEFYQGLATTGMGDRRQRVNSDALLNATIPLPPLDEQRLIADRLAQGRAALDALNEASSACDVPRVAELLRKSISQAFDVCSGLANVDDIATLKNDLVRPGEDPGEAREFVGLEHLVGHFGRRSGSTPVGGEAGRKFRFAPGDVLYGYLRPYQNKVWLADRHGLCSVEQFVLRQHRPEDAELLWFALRGQRVLDRVNSLTNSLQLPRLSSAKLLATELAWPSKRERERTLNSLRSIQDTTTQLAAAIEHRAALRSNVAGAMLNEVFSGRL